MASFFRAAAGQLDDAVMRNLERNLHYRATKKKLDEDAEFAKRVEKVSAFFGIAGVFVLTAVGMSCWGEGQFRWGAALISCDIPVSLFAYNCYTAAENFRGEVLENPLQLMVLTTPEKEIPINQIALRKCLLKGTVFFEPFLGMHMRVCIQNNLTPPSSPVSQPRRKK
jgi:hypothetical protein